MKAKAPKWLKVTLLVLCALLVLLALAVGYLLLMWKNADTLHSDTMFTQDQNAVVEHPESTAPAPDTEDETALSLPDAQTVSYQGAYYTPNPDVVAVLFMGVDRDSSILEGQTVQTGTHQADVLILGAFNTVTKQTTLINIPRDSMVDVYKLDAQYRYAYTERAQIATQYSFGDGAGISSAYTMDAVSRLLMGIPINRYVTLSLDGVGRAVEMVGGVPITVQEDLEETGLHLTAGEETLLNGAQAEAFCRSRDCAVDDSNLTRMQRQMLFCKSFLSVVKQRVKENPVFLLTLYNGLNQDYLTNLTFEEAILLAKQGLSFTFDTQSVVTVPGQMVEREYIVNDDALKAILMDVFYTKNDP